MSRLFMLDTNTVSCILKGKSHAARARLAGLGTDEVACISIITEFELEFGLAKNPGAQNLRAPFALSLRVSRSCRWVPPRLAPTANSVCGRKRQDGRSKAWTC